MEPYKRNLLPENITLDEINQKANQLMTRLDHYLVNSQNENHLSAMYQNTAAQAVLNFQIILKAYFQSIEQDEILKILNENNLVCLADILLVETASDIQQLRNTYSQTHSKDTNLDTNNR